MKSLFDKILAMVTGLMTATAVASAAGSFGPTNVCLLSSNANVTQTDDSGSCPAGYSSTKIEVPKSNLKCDLPGTTACTYCVKKVTEINSLDDFAIWTTEGASQNGSGTINCESYKTMGWNSTIGFPDTVSCYLTGRTYRVRIWIWDKDCSSIIVGTTPPVLKMGTSAEWVAR